MDKRELEQRWDRGGATAKRRRGLNETWSGVSVAAAAAAGAGQTVISQLRADKAAEAREDDVRHNITCSCCQHSVDCAPCMATTEHYCVVYTLQMARVTFNELTIRLGEEYLYLHQLDCEHSIVFTRMRIVSPAERRSLTPVSFPRHTRRHEENRRTCNACVQASNSRCSCRQTSTQPSGFLLQRLRARVAHCTFPDYGWPPDIQPSL